MNCDIIKSYTLKNKQRIQYLVVDNKIWFFNETILSAISATGRKIDTGLRLYVRNKAIDIIDSTHGNFYLSSNNLSYILNSYKSKFIDKHKAEALKEELTAANLLDPINMTAEEAASYNAVCLYLYYNGANFHVPNKEELVQRNLKLATQAIDKGLVVSNKFLEATQNIPIRKFEPLLNDFELEAKQQKEPQVIIEQQPEVNKKTEYAIVIPQHKVFDMLIKHPELVAYLEVI